MLFKVNRNVVEAERNKFIPSQKYKTITETNI